MSSKKWQYIRICNNGRKLVQTLGQEIALDVSIIVFASPHIPTLTFHSIGYHVVNQPVLIPRCTM
jgi:hypothetical protein